MKLKVNVAMLGAILVVSAVVPWMFAGATGGGVTSQYNNLVPLDAAYSWMNVSGPLLNNGTWAYVSVYNLTLGLGTFISLVNPNDSTVLNATVQPGNVVLFADANLSINGTWKVKNTILGTVISQFNVTIWDGVSVPGNTSNTVTLFQNELQFIPDVIGVYGLSGNPFQESEAEMWAATTNNTVWSFPLNRNIAMTNVLEPWFIAADGIDDAAGEPVLRTFVIPGPLVDSGLPACASQSAVQSTGSANTKFKCFTILAEGKTYGAASGTLYGAHIRATFAGDPIPALAMDDSHPTWQTT